MALGKLLALEPPFTEQKLKVRGAMENTSVLNGSSSFLVCYLGWQKLSYCFVVLSHAGLHCPESLVSFQNVPPYLVFNFGLQSAFLPGLPTLSPHEATHRDGAGISRQLKECSLRGFLELFLCLVVAGGPSE